MPTSDAAQAAAQSRRARSNTAQSAVQSRRARPDPSIQASQPGGSIRRLQTPRPACPEGVRPAHPVRPAVLAPRSPANRLFQHIRRDLERNLATTLNPHAHYTEEGNVIVVTDAPDRTYYHTDQLCRLASDCTALRNHLGGMPMFDTLDRVDSLVSLRQDLFV